jgi:DNA-binding response OmpR family regulator
VRVTAHRGAGTAAQESNLYLTKSGVISIIRGALLRSTVSCKRRWMSGSRILVIESDVSTGVVLRAVFLQKGIRVDHVMTGLEGLQTFDPDVHSAVIMSFDLPGLGGSGLLKALRNVTDAPVVVLSERADEWTRVAALDDGADDFVMKPFFPRELVARTRAALRRASGSVLATRPIENNADTGILPRPSVDANVAFLSQQPQATDLQTNRLGMVMNDKQLRVDVNGVRLNFSNREYAIFSILASHLGDLVSKEQLLIELQATNLKSTTKVLDVYLGRIRRALIKEPNCGLYVRNVRRRGWSLEALTEG